MLQLFKEEKEQKEQTSNENMGKNADKDIYISMLHNIIDKLEDLITIMED